MGDLGGRRHGGGSLRGSEGIPQTNTRLYPRGTESQAVGRLQIENCQLKIDNCRLQIGESGRPLEIQVHAIPPRPSPVPRPPSLVVATELATPNSGAGRSRHPSRRGGPKRPPRRERPPGPRCSARRSSGGLYLSAGVVRRGSRSFPRRRPCGACSVPGPRSAGSAPWSLPARRPRASGSAALRRGGVRSG